MSAFAREGGTSLIFNREQVVQPAKKALSGHRSPLPLLHVFHFAAHGLHPDSFEALHPSFMLS